MQVTFLQFWTDLLTSVCAFLLTEPIVYFTGILVLLFVVMLVKRIISVR